jgi:hypothetical protein
VNSALKKVLTQSHPIILHGVDENTIDKAPENATLSFRAKYGKIGKIETAQ